MNTVSSFIKRESEKLGYNREYFVESNIPVNQSNIVVITFYGELRSLFIFATFVLKQLVEQNPDKYYILCSWPNMRGLFPYVNEYWSLKDVSMLNNVGATAEFFGNTNDFTISEYRNLIYRFENVYKTDDFAQNKFDKMFLTNVPSINKLPNHIIRRLTDSSVFLFPSKQVYTWEMNNLKSLSVSKTFWIKIIEKLIDEGYAPVIWQNCLTHDVSPEFAEKCVYLNNMAIEDVLITMHKIGCVLDIFSGVSRLAIQGRTPFVAVDERERYIKQNDGFVDSHCLKTVEKLYVFSSAVMTLSGNLQDWCNGFLDAALGKLEYLKKHIDKPQDLMLNQVYETIKVPKVKSSFKKIGLHFINRHLTEGV